MLGVGLKIGRVRGVRVITLLGRELLLSSVLLSSASIHHSLLVVQGHAVLIDLLIFLGLLLHVHLLLNGRNGSDSDVVESAMVPVFACPVGEVSAGDVAGDLRRRDRRGRS